MHEFDEIAEEWDEYRSKPSSALKFFLPLLQPRDVVLDAGCGNARNLVEVAKKCALAYGVDSSKKMLELAKEKTNKFDNVVLLDANLTQLPLQHKSVDKILCLAVLHHLRTEKDRLAALREFHRVLKSGGLVFASVWNKRQKKFASATSDGALIKWEKKDGTVVERYYHFFEENELRALAEVAGFRVKEVFYEKSGERAAADGAFNLCEVLKNLSLTFPSRIR